MSNSRVLVVDDDRSHCDIVARLLSTQGFTVDIASDGLAALELVRRNPYVVAVLDYQMPGMNGVELFRQAKEIQPDLRALFLTAYTNISTVFPAIEAGAERVLAKPVNANELLSLVDELIRPRRPIPS